MKKNVLALTLGAAMVAGAAAPAFADGHTFCADINDVIANHMDEAGVNSVETVEYDEDIEMADGTYGTSVYAVIGSVYKVTIPKVIVLQGVQGGTSSATYYVDVDGDIAGHQYVKVAPDASFAMKQAGKADVTAVVTQKITDFLASNTTLTPAGAQVALNADAADSAAAKSSEASGTVKADLSAGKWAGTFDFEISLENLE